MNIGHYFGTPYQNVVRMMRGLIFTPPANDVAPTPSVDNRGGLYRTEGGPGVSDSLIALYKDATNTYTTRDLLAASSTPAPVNATYITQTPNGTLTNEQALSALATGIVKNTTGTGVLSIAVAGVDYAAASHTHAESDVTNLVTDLAAKAPVGATYITQTANATLTNEQALGALATGIVKNTTATGVLSIAVAGTDYAAASHTHAESDVTNLVTDLAAKAPVGAKYIVQQADATLTAEQSLGALATGIVKNTTTTGVLSIAVAGTDYAAASHTHAESDVTNLVTDLAAKAPVGAKYIVQQADATLTAEQSLGALATGIVKNTTTTGVLSIAVAGTDYAAASHTHAESDVTSLVSDLAGKAPLGSALTEVAEASQVNVAGGTSAVPGAAIRLYGLFQLPTTEKFYIITGIEWLNKATVNGSVYCGVDIINSITASASGTALAAVGRPIAQAGASAAQRNSDIASQPIRGGTFIGVWFASTSATATFGQTAVAASNKQKAIAAAAPATADFTAWTSVTVEYYVKVYYRGYN